MAATICNFPKYLLYVFVGSRMASLSDGKQRERMDTRKSSCYATLEATPNFPTETIVVNSILIVGGIFTSVATGWLVHYLEHGLHH